MKNLIEEYKTTLECIEQRINELKALNSNNIDILIRIGVLEHERDNMHYAIGEMSKFVKEEKECH